MRPVKFASVPFALVLAGAALGAEPLPLEFMAATSKAKIADPIVGWCGGEFRSGHPGGFAIAVSSAQAGGRYLVVEANGQVIELASFSGRADLSCYTTHEARKLDQTISRSATIHRQRRAGVRHDGDLRIRGRNERRLLAVFARPQDLRESGRMAYLDFLRFFPFFPESSGMRTKS